MQKINRIVIDWPNTAKNLKLLRQDNLNLRRYVCGSLYFGERNCAKDCEECKTYNMDHSISQAELARVFNVSESSIVNWESERSKPSIEDILFYSQICKIDLLDVLIVER